MCFRSLAACEQLYKVGYRNLYWLSGGLDAVDEGVCPRLISLPAPRIWIES